MNISRWVYGLSLGAFALVLCTAGLAQAAEKPGQEGDDGQCAEAELPLCPVSGETADLSVKKVTDEGPIFFCCKDCIAKYEASPSKYAEKVAQQRKALATLPKVQKTCPVSGKPIDKEMSLEVDGQAIFFCCDKCPAEYKKDPAKYKAKLANSYEYFLPALCPLTGERVNFAVSLDTKDGPLYFCCKGCVGKYKADPDKWAKQAAGQQKALAALPRVQVKCPVSGKPVNQKIFTEKDGKKTYFASKDALAQYEKDPAAFKARLAGSYTYQTMCPVMSEEVVPSSYIDLKDGLRIYLCCDGCKKKLLDNPAKYVGKLVAQGIRISAEDIKPKS
jgi:YHS domain-containing protein